MYCMISLNYSTGKSETGGIQIQDQSGLHNTFKGQHELYSETI